MPQARILVAVLVTFFCTAPLVCAVPKPTRRSAGQRVTIATATGPTRKMRQAVRSDLVLRALHY